MSINLSSAVERFRAGDLNAAQRLCRSALVQEPSHPGALNLLAVSRFQDGHADAAIPPLDRVARLQPEWLEAISNLAVVLQSSHRPKEAASRYRQTLAVLPTSVLALGRLAVLEQERGNEEAARHLLRRAVRVAPAAVQERFNLAQIAHASGHSAEADLRALIALDPGAAGGYALLGAVYLTIGQAAAASVAFQRAHRLDPAHHDAGFGLTRSQRYLQAVRASRNPDTRPGILVRGPLTPVSGYGHMTCRFLDHLLRQGMPLQAMGLFGPEAWPGAEMPVRAKVGLHFLIPSAVEPIPGTRTMVFSMFEGTRIPPAWRRYSDRHDLVIVPCEASRQAWLAQGYPAERLRICPLGVDPVPASGPTTVLGLARGRPVSSYRTRILNISDFIPRKNVDGLLRVWLKSTRADDDAVLILKLGKGNAASEHAIDALVARTEQAVGKRLADAAAVTIVNRRLSEEEMDGLYPAATHYWSLSHGEGWDLPLTRAGAHGLGLIAPHHSAYEDYLDESVARLIPSRAVPAHQPYSDEPWPPFFGLDWWEPDEDAACATVAAVVQGHDPLPDARSHLLGQFSWERAAARLRSLVGEVVA